MSANPIVHWEIMGPDGAKLSKRHGAVSVEEYKKEGFLPEAMVNFLALMGWIATCELVLTVRLPRPLPYMLAALPVWTAFAMHPEFSPLLLLGFVWFMLFVVSSREKGGSFGHFFAAIWLLCWLFVFAFALSQTHESESGRALIIGTCLEHCKIQIMKLT